MRTHIRRLPPLPSQPGVYVLRDGEQVLYVGMTANLNHRVRKHSDGSWKISKVARHILHDVASDQQLRDMMLDGRIGSAIVRDYLDRSDVTVEVEVCESREAALVRERELARGLSPLW